ncbi:MAG: HD domain-containing protein [Synergistaceae bacterium]|nr:HD domain-containing protein [Synergistaceae bacterium]
MVTSVNSVLVYIPIFLILFAAIAVLEDVGYMPRMAFILDRLFRRFGLHGQSTLPLILGGVFVGGCAVPGVMATRVIADEKARLATVLIVPLMNCMAKIPLYTLLVGAFFVTCPGAMMVFISTITIIVALAVAKVLSLTVLKNKPSSPFVMEMPPYHVPTLFGVLQRSVERTWLFCRKILTVIALVAVAVFFLTHYPQLPDTELEHFEARGQRIRAAFLEAVGDGPYGTKLADETFFLRYLDVQDRYRQARLAGMRKDRLEQRFAGDADILRLIELRDDEGKRIDRAYKTLRRDRLGLIHDYDTARLNNSLLGRMGKALEPVTRFAGFSWKVNVALLSASGGPLFELAATIALEHHEKWDGSGYPQGLSGEAISYEARLVAIVDVFDALAGRRPYKAPWPLDRIVHTLIGERGRHFDPAVVDLFLDNLDCLLDVCRNLPNCGGDEMTGERALRKAPRKRADLPRMGIAGPFGPPGKG